MKKAHWFFIVVSLSSLAMYIPPMSVSPNKSLGDAQILARIAEGEAEILGREGMLAIMWVAHNRVEDAHFPNDYEAVSEAFYGCKQSEAKSEIVAAALGFLAKAQRGDDPTNGAIYAYSLTDVRHWELPPAGGVVPDEPVMGQWQLHLYREIDWAAWRAARRGR